MVHERNNLSAEKVMDLFNEKKYEELIELTYTNSIKKPVRLNNSNFAEDFITLRYLCFATYLAGYFYDCLFFIDSIFSCIPREEEIYTQKDRVYFTEYALESLLFYFLNGLDGKQDYKPLIDDLIARAPTYYEACNQKDHPLFDNLKKTYDLYCEGKRPHYTLTFFVPFLLNFEKHTFDLIDAPPYKEMSVVREVRGSVEGMKFSVTIEGFVKADSWWKGPKWEERQELFVAIPALNMVNRLLEIIAESERKDFIPRIRPNQLSSVDIHQFMGDGQLYHFCSGTMFGAHFIKQWFQSPQYQSSELEQLNRLLVEAFHYPLYATLFHQAQNTINAGLYEESFMTLCACAEATIHYWCRQLAQKNKLDSEYDEFEKGKPVCEACSLYQKEPNAKDVGKNVMPPSIYHYPKFLRKNRIIDREQEDELCALIRISRNDDLRNALMHGKVNSISFIQLKACQSAIEEMNERFICIMNKYGLVDNSKL